MSDVEPGTGQTPMTPETPVEPQREVPVVGEVVHAVKRTSRFSKEVVATMISLATAAFGVVAALAWNSAITTLFQRYYPLPGTPLVPAGRISALFIYAIVVTLVGVVVIVVLSRLAARINAQPVEFKYPAVPKS
jgi:MFS superfamily sulfate permease-like transporter